MMTRLMMINTSHLFEVFTRLKVTSISPPPQVLKSPFFSAGDGLWGENQVTVDPSSSSSADHNSIVMIMISRTPSKLWIWKQEVCAIIKIFVCCDHDCHHNDNQMATSVSAVHCSGHWQGLPLGFGWKTCRFESQTQTQTQTLRPNTN